MKRNLVPYLVGLFFLVVVGTGAMIGQEPVPFEIKAPPPAAPGQDVLMYWNADGEEAPPPVYLLADPGQAPAAIPMPPQVGIQRFGGGEAGPWLGVVLSDISQEKAKELKLAGENSVLVKEVREESPAAKAGLMKDDVIVEFAGEKVRSAAQLRRLVSETPPERSVTLVVNRAGQTKSLTAQLASRPVMREFTFALPAPQPGTGIEIPQFDVLVSRGARLGISGDDLTTQLAQFFGVKQGKGVLVREVTVGSAADKGGLKAGDVIVAVDGKEVASVGQLRRALAGQKIEAEKRKVTLAIVRDKHEQTVTVELDAPERIGPRPFMRAELGVDPEEMKEMAAEMDARAKEMAQQWREHAKHFAEQHRALQSQWQKEQQQLQKEMQRLQEELPKIEQEIKRDLNGLKVELETI